MAGETKIPGNSVDTSGKDLLSPLVELLSGINLLASGTGSSGGAFQSPLPNAAIIETGATSLTKWWSGAVAAVGGGTAITGVATGFWNAQTGGTRIALVGATGAILAVSIIALAIIVSSDVRGRALGASAVYGARAKIAESFLQAASTASTHGGSVGPAEGGAVAPGNPPVAAAHPAVPADLDAVVSAALQRSVDPLSATLVNLDGTLNTLDRSIARLKKPKRG